MNRDIASVLFKPLKAPSAAATGGARVFAPHTETTVSYTHLTLPTKA